MTGNHALASAFGYRDGTLCAEAVPLSRIADAVGTPLYCYSSAALEANYRALAGAFAGRPVTICFALKANGNLAVVRTLALLGAGADVVSEGEIRRALAAGVPAGNIVFSGVGKTRDELAFALDTGVRQINVESSAELEALSEVAVGRGAVASVLIRVNPDVDAGTHAKITTGTAENKFGIDLDRIPEVWDRALALDGIRPEGVAVHIGSQVLSLAPYREAYSRLAGLVGELRAAGHTVSRIDLGGGLGIPYRDETPPDLAAFAAMVEETVGGLGCALILEPGRALVGNAGILLTRVLYLKRGAQRRFVIVDAAMNDLKRPAMYDAHHEVLPVAEPAADAVEEPVDIVGPICESGDRFAALRPLVPVEQGELLAIASAGAYSAVMASTYNSRLLVPEVLVRSDAFALVRPRPGYEDMLAGERLPPWLDGAGGTEAG